MKIRVVSPPHTMFAAKIMVSQLNKLGYDAIISYMVNPNKPDLYIIYNAATLRWLPQNYIVVQTEIAGSHWFNKNYFRVLSKAKAVWEYSESNIKAYRNMNKNIFIVSPGVEIQPKSKKDIDFLFYGYIKGSPRRKFIIDNLKKEVNLLVVDNKLQHEMWDVLRRTKVVVNVKYYDHSPVEKFRINEALSFGCKVVSEGYDERYNGLVSFCKTTQISNTCKKVIHQNGVLNLGSLSNIDELREAIKFSI